MKNSIFLTVVLGLFLASTAVALEPGDTLWTRTYGGSAGESGWSVLQTSDGGYALIGQAETYGPGVCAFWLVKTDANGDTLWTRAYGTSDVDRPRCAQQTTDGGYIMVGFTIIEQLTVLYLVKADSVGNEEWHESFRRVPVLMVTPSNRQVTAGIS